MFAGALTIGPVGFKSQKMNRFSICVDAEECFLTFLLVLMVSGAWETGYVLLNSCCYLHNHLGASSKPNHPLLLFATLSINLSSLRLSHPIIIMYSHWSHPASFNFPNSHFCLLTVFHSWSFSEHQTLHVFSAVDDVLSQWLTLMLNTIPPKNQFKKNPRSDVAALRSWLTQELLLPFQRRNSYPWCISTLKLEFLGSMSEVWAETPTKVRIQTRCLLALNSALLLFVSRKSAQ